LIQGLRIDAQGYIYQPVPPKARRPSQIPRAEKPKTLIPYVHQDLELLIKRRLVLDRF
jgi:hypothetical protein